MIQSEEVGTENASRARTRRNPPLEVNGAEIVSFLERIERLDAQIADVNSEKSDIWKEAKSRGYDVAVLRDMVKERRQDPDKRAEKETIFDLYQRAVAAVA